MLLACWVVVMPVNVQLQASVPTSAKVKWEMGYYDADMLKVIEDSLQKIDPRNSIIPRVGGFIPGKIAFDVLIYSPSQKKDQQNVTIKKNGIRNGRIAGALALSSVIAPCVYDPANIYMVVLYNDSSTEEKYFYTIINSNDHRSYCAGVTAKIEW